MHTLSSRTVCQVSNIYLTRSNLNFTTLLKIKIITFRIHENSILWNISEHKRQRKYYQSFYRGLRVQIQNL